MAKGSKRSFPTAPAWAAVVSELMIEPRNTPCSQSNASVTSGTLVARRPPNSTAEIGTPAGSSHSGAMDGHWPAGAVNRALGWAAGAPEGGGHVALLAPGRRCPQDEHVLRQPAPVASHRRGDP